MKIFNWLYIVILFIVPLIMGIFTFRDYGESIDENPLYTYSNYSLKAYEGLPRLDLSPKLGKGNFRYYGPAFLMASNLAAQFMTQSLPNINTPEAWHFMYFLSFLVCGVGLFFLARKWFVDGVALALALLFLFPPLLWGHAFINPKDIPFMAFVLLSVLASLTMQEKLFPNLMQWEYPKFTSLKHSWQQTKKEQLIKTIRILAGLIFIVLIYLFSQSWIERTVTYLLTIIYSSKSGGFFSSLFSFFAKNYRTIPLEYYVPKGIKTINIILIFLGTIFLFQAFSKIWELFTQSHVSITKRDLANIIKDILDQLKNPWVIIAGILLGINTSIRILGPALGFIALIISLYKAKAKALPAFTAYFLITSVTTYLTWPYLWPNPIGRLQAVLTYMSSFPWVGKVLFNGSYYPTNALPLGYVPALFGIQFTEPAVILFLFGAYLFGKRVWERTIKSEFTNTVLLWGVFPFLAFTILRPSLYDNIRQLLFLTPPLFLIIGLAIDWIFQRLHNPLVNNFVLLLLLLPGVIAIIDLHPYQYTYYNSFVGGLQGSYRRFESDYWATSFREAIEYLNRTAPENSKVLVYVPGNKEIADHFSRADLIVNSDTGTIYDPIYGFDYAIVTTRFDWDVQYYADWPTIYVVQRNNNVFAVVRKRP